MDLSTADQIIRFLAAIGARLPSPAEMYIFGGSALLLIGGRRNTADIDYALHASAVEQCRRIINEVAAELQMEVEENAPDGFMPLPAGAQQRHRLIGQYGSLSAYVLDPYSIAVMKVDRAFETDFEDVVYMLRNGHLELKRLEECIEDVARRYDEPRRLRLNFAELKRQLP